MEPSRTHGDSFPEDNGPAMPNPDAAEDDPINELDEIVPTRGYQMLPMVGLGGSAGSIPALLTFFEAMPANSGLVFVVVLHLAPEYDSTLGEVLQRSTKMPVIQVADGVMVEADHVYVIPPGKHLAAADGHLRLSQLLPERGRRVAVDLFFRTLADTHGPHAAAIVLSGADGDGAIGIKRIKERGGLTVAQDPEEAEFCGMPRSAIGTGMVDWVLRVGEMPQRLMEYVRREKQMRIPPEDGPHPATEPRPSNDEDEAALRDVLVFLRTRTSRDFSYYRRATILRRISRRMQVNGVDDLPAYLAYLRTHPGEAGALLADLLISVTNFFRDKEAFLALGQAIPHLFEGKGPGDSVRVWCAACATGEEAYSIAMLLCEHARTLESPPAIQVFATDLDEDVIAHARDGIYPDTIAADVNDERLRRFFVKEHRGYRVRREVREVVLFALHDLLKDSPFSRIDLVSCRNLLIYLNRDAQLRAFEIFHFSLLAEARLFLGTSESVEDGSELFAPVDKRHRIYRPRPTARIGLPVPMGRSTLALALDARERAAHRPAIPPARAVAGAAEPLPGLFDPPDRRAASWVELHFMLIEHLAPPSVLVNQEHDIMHLSENAGRFLQFPGGEPSKNLLRAVHPMLRMELRAMLYRAAQTGLPSESFKVPVELDGQPHLVNLRVSPASEIAPDFLLIVFELRDGDDDGKTSPHPHATDNAVSQHLEHELEGLKSHLRDIVEQYEASGEELKASNEELQAMNEELRSATEELETSREELQSINEELTTVNQELKSKVDELGHANSDLHNLMGATAIATVFLDRDLRIMRYTPTAVGLFHLIPSDAGRPLADLRRQIDYPELTADALRVLDQLAPVEREVRGEQAWYLARLLPYRTLDDHIAGVVLTFVDITARRAAEDLLNDHVDELTRFNHAAVGRETRMIELKREINTLCARLGLTTPYPMNFEGEVKPPPGPR